MKIDGACLCGDITWEAEIDPDKVGICHCTQCQVNGASAFQWAVQVPTEQFRLVSGELRAFVKTAESGNQRALSFCPNCGTTIHGGNAGASEFLSLRLGGCNQRHQLTPQSQVWHRSAQPWAQDLQAGVAIEMQNYKPR